MKIFLTGATGYIGYSLAMRLANENHCVHALVRDKNSNNCPIHMNITLFEGNLSNIKSIEEAMKGCKYVIHTAAFTKLNYAQIDPFFETNVNGTANVLDVSLKLGIQKFIHTSTLAVFGPAVDQMEIDETQPRVVSYQNDYELTKKMSEELVLNYVGKGLPACILNISRVFGPGNTTYSNGIASLIKMIYKRYPVFVPTKMDIKANYVFIQDVITAFINAIEYGKNGENYIIGGQNLKYSDLFSVIENALNRKTRLIKVNYNLMNFLLKVIETLYRLIGKVPPLTSQVLQSLFTSREANCNKAINDLKYYKTNFSQGLTKTIFNLKL